MKQGRMEADRRGRGEEGSQQQRAPGGGRSRYPLTLWNRWNNEKKVRMSEKESGKVAR